MQQNRPWLNYILIAFVSLLIGVSLGITYQTSYVNLKASEPVVLQWEAANLADAGVIGYRVYYGKAPGIYSQAKGEGLFTKTNSMVIANLPYSEKLYFTVTTVMADGNESGFAEEVSKVIE